MNKKNLISIYILFLSTTIVYGQKITLQKNINQNASQLLQGLNKNRDSLFLETKTNQIQIVDIFNSTFSERIDVNSNKTKIDLKQLPYGNFVIQAKVDAKWIVMYLEKNEIETYDTNTTYSRNSKLLYKSAKNNPLYYWVVSESNSNFGSSKTMSLEHRDTVAKLISKNKLELQSKVGKHNTLLVYAVYDKSKFMNKQFRNSNYYLTTKKSKFFDTKPFYSSKDKIETTIL